MKSLKTKRNTLIVAGSVVIALIQLLCAYLTKMDAVNIISFAIIHFFWQDFIRSTFDEKIEELATKNSGE